MPSPPALDRGISAIKGAGEDAEEPIGQRNVQRVHLAERLRVVFAGEQEENDLLAQQLSALLEEIHLLVQKGLAQAYLGQRAVDQLFNLLYFAFIAVKAGQIEFFQHVLKRLLRFPADIHRQRCGDKQEEQQHNQYEGAQLMQDAVFIVGIEREIDADRIVRITDGLIE